MWFQNARAKSKRAATASNRLIAISDRLSRNAWKNLNNTSKNDELQEKPSFNFSFESKAEDGRDTEQVIRLFVKGRLFS